MKITIDNTTYEDETLNFTIAGERDTGLEKSIVNSLRRILLTEIPCVGFRFDEGKLSDLKMETNKTSSHNEFLLHRISLIPLFIDPFEYNKDYLFQLQVKHNTNEPFLFVTSDMFEIYPLKDNLEDVNLNILDINNYDLKKTLSKEEKKKIIRPFIYKEREYYNLITELKNTYSSDSYNQEISLYGSPSVSNGKEHARWKAVSDAVYTFTKDIDMFKSVSNEKADLKNITNEAERLNFIKSLELSESERYFHRDVNGEPYIYDFKVTSCHYLKSKDLFILANNIMKNKLNNLKNNLILLVQGKETPMSVTNHKKSNTTYEILIPGEDDTLGNVIQSHVVNNFIDDKSLINICSYRRSHPLEEHIILTISINPENKIAKNNDEAKLNAIVKFLEDVINDISSIYDEIISVSEKLL
jgi:DNA-directed RNA polymerase subunit L